MIQDMGIHLSPENATGAAHFTSEELEIRNRLFWSAFNWDKSVVIAVLEARSAHATSSQNNQHDTRSRADFLVSTGA